MEDDVKDFERSKLIGLDKVAVLLDVSIREVYRMIATGELPRPVKIGRLSKLPFGDVLGYIEKLKSSRVEAVTKV
jgi:excisionase family DNA binding protein